MDGMCLRWNDRRVSWRRSPVDVATDEGAKERRNEGRKVYPTMGSLQDSVAFRADRRNIATDIFSSACHWLTSFSRERERERERNKLIPNSAFVFKKKFVFESKCKRDGRKQKRTVNGSNSIVVIKLSIINQCFISNPRRRPLLLPHQLHSVQSCDSRPATPLTTTTRVVSPLRSKIRTLFPWRPYHLRRLAPSSSILTINFHCQK